MNAIVIPFPADRAAAAKRARSAPADDWSARAHHVLDDVADLLAGGDAAQVVQLCQQAVDALERSAPDITDDEPLAALAERLGDLHLQACGAARPDPIGLARWLFRTELHGELGAVSDVATRYADVLGVDGLAEYRRLARAAARRPPVTALTSRARHPSAVS